MSDCDASLRGASFEGFEDAIDAFQSTILDHLTALVGFDTQNPPREIGTDGIFAYLVEHLDGFEYDLVDLGDGCISLHAWRGEPTVLFNFHVDTVPASDAWQRDPFELAVEAGRAVGLGACDINGASACMLAALSESDAPVGLLFTSDEEAGSSRCVREFVDDEFAYQTVVVAEPTNARAVLEHRGIITASGEFAGVAGHASARRALDDSAVHRLMRWGRRALAFAEEHESTEYGPLSGIRLNIGRVDGGIKPNVIAPSARVRFGCRPLPHQDAHELLGQIEDLAGTDDVVWKEGFYGPTLPAGAGDDGDVAASARTWAEHVGLTIGEPVDFWTEASLFSEAGYTALVFGPGDIAQAHAAGEWVALEQLDRVARTYVDLLESGATTS